MLRVALLKGELGFPTPQTCSEQEIHKALKLTAEKIFNGEYKANGGSLHGLSTTTQAPVPRGKDR
jgi:hypothetical protein